MLKLCLALAKLARILILWLASLPRQAAIALGAPLDGQPADARRLWKTLAIALPPAMLAAWALPQLNLVMSPSIDAWVLRTSPGPIRKGDYVRFILAHPSTGTKPVSITKYALCMPGDRLTMTEAPSATAPGHMDGRYFCNGHLLGMTLPFGADGHRLAHMRWSGTIPPEMAYIGSNHPRGFDSRYFGLVPIAALTRMSRLL